MPVPSFDLSVRLFASNTVNAFQNDVLAGKKIHIATGEITRRDKSLKQTLRLAGKGHELTTQKLSMADR